MKKECLYLDTSVPSFLFADDAPEKRDTTRRFWELLKIGLFKIIISDILFIEIAECENTLRTALENKISEIEKETVSISEEGIALAEKYIQEEIIPTKFRDDAFHIALATMSECDVLVSWNFKHIVKLKTILAVEKINKKFKYKAIHICSPEEI
jgi:predicted nucleic acid-binding protein